MYLYLSESPTRTLYLVTSPEEEFQGRPSRALVFRAADDRPSQAIVEFLPKSEVDLSNVIKLSNRIVKGCLGLVSIAGGKGSNNICPFVDSIFCLTCQIYSSQSSLQRRKSATRDHQQHSLRLWLKFMKLDSTH